MHITIVCVGKLKEKYLKAGLAEYSKRLGPFCKLNIKELAEEKMPASPSDAQKEQVLHKETDRILTAIPDSAYVILLDLKGKEITSPELAEKIDSLKLQGNSNLVFVIGGAFGYTDDLRKRADFRWSFSPLTFTHQMIRMMLVEQIYRAFKISRGEKYHW